MPVPFLSSSLGPGPTSHYNLHVRSGLLHRLPRYIGQEARRNRLDILQGDFTQLNVPKRFHEPLYVTNLHAWIEVVEALDDLTGNPSHVRKLAFTSVAAM